LRRAAPTACGRVPHAKSNEVDASSREQRQGIARRARFIAKDDTRCFELRNETRIDPSKGQACRLRCNQQHFASVRARNLPGEAQHCREQTQENERRSHHARSVQAMSIPQARNRVNEQAMEVPQHHELVHHVGFYKASSNWNSLNSANVAFSR
jgi:hypothetical protein